MREAMMMIIIIGNGNGNGFGCARHPPASRVLDWILRGVRFYAFTTWVWFSFGFGFIEWHMSRYLCQALSTFLSRRKNGSTLSECFFGVGSSIWREHWSGQTCESRYISLPVSMKCKHDSHNVRRGSPNEYSSSRSPRLRLYSPESTQYCPRNSGIYAVSEHHSHLHTQFLRFRSSRSSSPGDGKHAVQHDTHPVLYLQPDSFFVNVQDWPGMWWLYTGSSREGGGRRLLVEDAEWG